jgi:hypothetical protein
MAYFGTFSGLFDLDLQIFLEETLELLSFGDELFLAEIGYGSYENPIDLTESEDEDEHASRIRFWVIADEVENQCSLLNQ